MGRAWEWFRRFLLSAEFQQMLQLAAGELNNPCCIVRFARTSNIPTTCMLMYDRVSKCADVDAAGLHKTSNLPVL